MEEMIKLTNGKKTIIRSKIQYEANVAHSKIERMKLFQFLKPKKKKARKKK